MLEFLKGLFGNKKRMLTESDTISEADLKGEADSVEKGSLDEKRFVDEFTLSLHPVEDAQTSDMQKDFMKKELSELSPVKEGDIAINGAYAVKSGDRLEVGFYIRNALARPVRLYSMPLEITNLKDEVLARQDFDLGEIGEIPSCSARPWVFYFDKKNVFAKEIKPEDWKVGFDVRLKYVNAVKPKLILPKQVEEQREVLEQFLDDLPPLRPGELRFSPFQVGLQEGGKLLATVIIRNGSKRTVKFDNLNLLLKDSQGQEVAKSKFKINNLMIQSKTAYLWTFAFPPESVLVENPDLSHWNIDFEK